MEQSGKHSDLLCGENTFQAAPNVWMVAVPWYSHMLCHLNLAKKLAKYGLTVTFFAPDDEIKRLIASEVITQDVWKREGLDIRLQALPIPALTLGRGQGVSESMKNTMRSMSDVEAAFEVVLRTSSESHAGPACVISDLWLPGTREVATRHNIPAWMLCSFSATYVASSYYLQHLGLAGVLDLPTSESDPRFQNEFFSLPGLSSYPFKDFPKGCMKDHYMFELVQRNALALEKADVVLVSSFKELEESGVRALHALLRAAAIRNHRKEPHVWTVGPTFSFSDTNEAEEEKKHPIMRFLDSQPEGSVLYVAFGGDINLSQAQMLEITYGLDNSKQPFLCLLRPPLNTPDCQVGDIFSVIPPDLVERTKHRGLFVQGWAPQMKVLAHPSTGGFLSHCGFNSMLESICMGVRIIGWPFIGDQALNCRWLVDEAELGLEICRGPDGYVGRGEVERAVRALFHSEEGRAASQRALRFKALARQSVGEKGSTTKHMRALVDLIRAAYTFAKKRMILATDVNQRPKNKGNVANRDSGVCHLWSSTRTVPAPAAAQVVVWYRVSGSVTPNFWSSLTGSIVTVDLKESDFSSSESEEEEDAPNEEQHETPLKEARKDAIYGTYGTHENLEDIGWVDDLHWVHTCIITYLNRLRNVDVKDDLYREMAFSPRRRLSLKGLYHVKVPTARL